MLALPRGLGFEFGMKLFVTVGKPCIPGPRRAVLPELLLWDLLPLRVVFSLVPPEVAPSAYGGVVTSHAVRDM